MKKVWFKSVAVLIIIGMLLSVNVYAVTTNAIDVVLNSGDVVEKFQYYEGCCKEGNPHYNPDFKYVNTVTFNAFGSEPIIVNDSGFCGYINPNDNVKKIIFNGTGDIILGSSAFAITAITDLNLPSNIKFEDEAIEVFSQSAVKSVTIGCSMCEGMFYGCNNLVDIKFTPDNKISIIPKSAFELAEVKKIEIPASVKVIDDFAFYTSRLSELKLNEGLETIGESAFQVWGQLETVTLPSTVKTIGDYSFSYSGLQEVNLNEGLESIGKQAFDGNMDMKSILVPKSVTNIGKQAIGYLQGKTIDGFTIYGYTGTAAEKYADENGFTFIPLDAESSVEGVSYTPIWNSVNDYSFKVGNRPLKLQVIEANGATRTFTRHASNVDIKAYDNQGNEVHDTSADLAYEVWTVKTRLTPDSDLKVRAKYDNVWENAAYDFRVTTLYSDQTLKSAELAKESGSLAPVDCKIVTGSGVKKVRIEYEDGMTTTANTSLATFDETNLTYTYNITAKPRHGGENLFKVYIKTSDGWKLATTLTYTAE